MTDQLQLSDKELKILSMMAKGLTLKEIAFNAEISHNTVRFHQKNIYKKLNVTNRVNAIQYAKSYGLIKSEESLKRKLVQAAYDGFLANDPNPQIDLLHPEVEWISDSPQDAFPHAGRTVGKSEAIDRILAIGQEYSPIKLSPQSFIEDGNELSVILDVELIHLPTKTHVAFDVAHFWLFDGELVIRYREVFNSGSVMKQIGTVN